MKSRNKWIEQQLRINQMSLITSNKLKRGRSWRWWLSVSVVHTAALGLVECYLRAFPFPYGDNTWQTCPNDPAQRLIQYVRFEGGGEGDLKSSFWKVLRTPLIRSGSCLRKKKMIKEGSFLKERCTGPNNVNFPNWNKTWRQIWFSILLLQVVLTLHNLNFGMLEIKEYLSNSWLKSTSFIDD